MLLLQKITIKLINSSGSLKIYTNHVCIKFNDYHHHHNHHHHCHRPQHYHHNNHHSISFPRSLPGQYLFMLCAASFMVSTYKT